jgi:hypothetical protein
MPSEYDELKASAQARAADRAESGLEPDPEVISRELTWRWWAARIRGLESFYSLREEWSGNLRNMLWTLVGLQALLLLAVGRGWLQFADYKAFLAAQAGIYFLQIAGMCSVVVAFLFHKPDATTSANSGDGPEQSGSGAVEKP